MSPPCTGPSHAPNPLPHTNAQVPCGLAALHTGRIPPAGVAFITLIKVVKQHVGPEREGLAPARNTLASSGKLWEARGRSARGQGGVVFLLAGQKFGTVPVPTTQPNKHS